MPKVERCYNNYRASWDVVAGCELPRRHKGPHGPLVIQKPALAVESSETSKDAARKIEPVRGSLRDQVYQELRIATISSDGGATDEEAMSRLDMNPSTYRPRRVELVEMNIVRDSGRTRATKSGRKAAVWESVRDAS